jgi:voltage-gated potassium channel
MRASLDKVNRRLLLATLLIFLILLFAPIFFWTVEQARSDDINTIGDAYGWLFRTLFENSSPYKLRSQFGFVSYWLVRVAGVSLVAVGTATLASRFVSTVIKQGAGMGTYKGSGHLLVCGWNRKGSEIVRELRAREVEDEREIVILADREMSPLDEKGITFIRGNPSSADDLTRAGLERVSTVIVLADESNISNAPDDVDARSLLTTLAVETINHEAYSCVEVIKSENRPHFERTHADELVVSAELTGALLAASARTHGLSGVVADLLTHPEGQELYRIPLPVELVNQSARHALDMLKDHHDSLLVGVFIDGRCLLNPANDTVLPAGSELLVVRARPPVERR